MCCVVYYLECSQRIRMKLKRAYRSVGSHGMDLLSFFDCHHQYTINPVIIVFPLLCILWSGAFNICWWILILSYDWELGNLGTWKLLEPFRQRLLSYYFLCQMAIANYYQSMIHFHMVILITYAGKRASRLNHNIFFFHFEDMRCTDCCW